jgi:hypothetical protein
MKKMRWLNLVVGISIGLLLVTGPLATSSPAAGGQKIMEFRSSM